ncbi:MAG: HisA/HisF-related TIM barrel protein [Thermoplasmatota archaeon]
MEFIDRDIPSDFELVPSLAVMGTNAVWVKNDMYNQIALDGEPVPVVGTAGRLLEKYGKLHYLDILGIRKDTVEWNLVQAVARKDGEVWADTGVEISEGVIDPLMAGMDQVIISTKMISSLEEIASCLELTENIILQIDFDGGIVSKDRTMRKMSPGDLVEEMASLGLGKFLIEDIKDHRKSISRELTMGVLRTAPGGSSIYAGIQEMDEVEDLAQAGLDGVVISASRLIEGLD